MARYKKRKYSLWEYSKKADNYKPGIEASQETKPDETWS